MTGAPLDGTPGWAARLTLAVDARAGRSVLTRRAHVGPLRVQRSLYPEGEGVCHVVIVHPPGGVVGGDTLELEVEVASGAHALVTTPAATKLYRSAGALARLDARLRVADQGGLEYLPQESIAFEGCRARSQLTIDLAAGARFVGWEVAVLGRSAAEPGFARGSFEQRLVLERDGRPLLIERACHDGGHVRQRARWGLAGHAVVGTMIMVGPAGAVEALRAASAFSTSTMAATRLETDVTLVRYLGDDPRAALAAFEAMRGIVRPALFARPAIAPRIWAT